MRIIINIIVLSLAIFIGIELLNKEFNSFYSFVLFIGMIGSLIFVINTLCELLEPKNELIKYNDKIKKITIRQSLFKKDIIDAKDLNKIEFEMINDLVRWGSRLKRVHFIEIYLVTKNQTRIKLLDIHTNYILVVGDYKIKKELLINAKPLVKKIAEKLNIEARYNGIIEK